MDALQSYEVFSRDWVKPVRKLEAFLEHLGVDWRKFSVSQSDNHLEIVRVDLRDDDVEKLTEWEWEQFRRCVSASEYVSFDRQHQFYTIETDNLDDLLEQNGYDYMARKDPWVLKYLLYAEGMHRGEVAEIFHVSRNAISVAARKLGVSEAWKERDLMEHLYVDKEMSKKQIAEFLSCGESTVAKWLQKHEIQEINKNGDLDRELVERLFFQGESFHEIANHAGCSPKTVKNWVEKWGIERRDVENDPVRYKSAKGYPSWILDLDGQRSKIRVHRLAAVSKWGLEELDGMVVHHKNGVPWDNSLSNLELMTNESHAKHHNRD